MIVQCIDIANEKQHQEHSDFNAIHESFHYNVLAITFCEVEGIILWVFSDVCGIKKPPIKVRAKNFKFITQKGPENWTLNSIHRKLNINPVKWVLDNLWSEQFSENYDHVNSQASNIKEDIKIILATDTGYISQMINERANNEKFKKWHESLVPFFDFLK